METLNPAEWPSGDVGKVQEFTLSSSVRVPQGRPGLRVAIVGCGYWGSKHVRVFSGTAGVAEIVVVEPNEALSRQLQLAFPAVRSFQSLQAALPYVDAVVIATPPRTHSDLALLAIRAGKHVLVEKPLATSVAAARQLVDQAHQNQVVLMVGHTFQFNPAVRELRRRLVAGEFGEIYYIHSARLNLGLYRPDVNVVWDLAPHDISIMNYLLDSTPQTATAWGASLAFGGIEDLAYIQLKYDNPKVTGYVHLSWLDPRKTRTVTVVGSKKMAVYDDIAEERLRIYDRGIEGGFEDGPHHERPPAYRYGDIVTPHIRTDEPLAVQGKHFVDSIGGSVDPESNGSHALAIVSVLEAIDRSMQKRTLIPIRYPRSFGRNSGEAIPGGIR